MLVQGAHIGTRRSDSVKVIINHIQNGNLGRNIENHYAAFYNIEEGVTKSRNKFMNKKVNIVQYLYTIVFNMTAMNGNYSL